MRPSLAAGVLLSIVSISPLAFADELAHEKRDVPPFAGVSVSSGIHAVVEPGERAPLEVDASPNLLKVLETVVEGDTLHIRFRRGASVWNAGDVTVKVRAPALRSLEASGGAEIRGAVAKGDELDVGASGGAEVHLRAVDVAELSVSGSGGATLELEGRAAKAAVEMSGGTRAHLGKLVAKKMRVQGSGGCEAEVQALEELRGNLSGGSEVALKGGARAHVSTSGGSSLHTDE